MKVYRGHRQHGGSARVTVTGDAPGSTHGLAPRTDLQCYTTEGFTWGAVDAGAAQLALAILADAFNDATALEYHEAFRDMTTGCFSPDTPWELTQAVVAKATLLCLLDRLDEQQLVEFAETQFLRPHV